MRLSILTALTAAMLAILPLSANAAGAKFGGLAAVNSDGTLHMGVNVKSVTRINTGQYYVKFKRSVKACYFFASPTRHQTQQSFALSLTTTPLKVASNGKTVLVRVWENYDQDSLNHDFYLQVIC